MVSRPAHRLIAARSVIAAACLSALPRAELGDVCLRDDQRRIVARAQRAIDRHGGCLVAEDVGRGKTFIALALARAWQHPLILVPAALTSAWRAAALRAGVACTLASHESLSRGRMPPGAFEVIIVDESHHFRTMSTRRHAALALLAARAPVVLLSATPLQNRTRDLAAQVALFVGERALTMEAAALSRFVIRGGADTDQGMPVVRAPEWIVTASDDGDTLQAILALPPPARPLDGGDAGALRTIGLVRAWASSRAALHATIRSRDRLTTAIAQGLETGRAPTRREARAWHAAEGLVQLGFSSLLIAASPQAAQLTDLRAALDEDRRAMDTLARRIRESPNPDVARVTALRTLRAAHPGRRILAFSEYASTISALYGFLRGEAGVGMLTAREARIATGRIARDEMLARFAPVAQRSRVPAPHQAVTLLLATDLLSEGVNLQDASVVVHLDLPWNPARLAQRVGRVRRIGGADDVLTFIFEPPAQADVLLNADARLRRKLLGAERVMGAGFPVLPPLSRASPVPVSNDVGGSAEAEGTLIARLCRWAAVDLSLSADERCMVAAVESDTCGWLAALDDGRLLAAVDGGAADEWASVTRAAELAEGSACVPRDDDVSAARASIEDWLSAESLANSCGLTDAMGPMARSIQRWVGSAAALVPRHQRGVLLPLVGRLRACLDQSLPLGAQRIIAAETSRALDRRTIVCAMERAVAAAEAACAFRVVCTKQRMPSVVALIVFDLSPQQISRPSCKGAERR